jgi:hypothetical protein
VVDAVTFESAVSEDLPSLHAGEGVLDAGAVSARGFGYGVFELADMRTRGSASQA